MVPKSVEFRAELPKTDTGKISRRLAAESVETCKMTIPPLHDLSKLLEIDAEAEIDRIATELRGQLRRHAQARRRARPLGRHRFKRVACLGRARRRRQERVLHLHAGRRFRPGKPAAGPARRRSIRRRGDRRGYRPDPRRHGCYERRDAFIRELVPDYGAGWECKIVIANALEGEGYNISSLVVQDPMADRPRLRMPPAVYLGIVAATNMKQRTRKQIEYYHADRLNYAVVGTPNRLEYDQGFFVKNGDGAADVKPIAHLYKTQVYALAAHLGVPEEIRRRPPTTDTYSLAQTQEEFYFSLPYDRMDLCLYGLNHGIAPPRSSGRPRG